MQLRHTKHCIDLVNGVFQTKHLVKRKKKTLVLELYFVSPTIAL